MSIGFPRQKYWSEVPFPSPGDFPHPGMEQRSPVLPVGSLLTEPPGKPLDVFRPLMCKVIVGIVRLISTVFVIVFYLLLLFFVSVFVFH